MFVAGPCTNQPRFADGRVADEDTFYQLLVGLLVVHASIGGTIPHFWNDSSSGLAVAAALSKTLRFPANSPLFCIISATSELGSRLAATRVLDFFFLANLFFRILCTKRTLLSLARKTFLQRWPDFFFLMTNRDGYIQTQRSAAYFRSIKTNSLPVVVVAHVQTHTDTHTYTTVVQKDALVGLTQCVQID